MQGQYTLNKGSPDALYGRKVPKDMFMSLRRKVSVVAPAYKAIPDFEQFRWEKILSDEGEHSMIVFRRPFEEFVATCSFQNNSS